jgi:hypothetical protein
MKFRRFVAYTLILVFSIILAKEYTAIRAHKFIVECLSQRELEAVVSKEIHSKPIEYKREFVAKSMACIEGKQSKLEIFVTRLFGNSLFYRPWD